MSLIYKTSEDLVKDLKKNFKPYKKLILENTARDKRFPLICLPKCHRLDKCVQELNQNENKYNHSIDRRIHKILQKRSNGSNGSVEEPPPDQPPPKKRKIVSSLLDLNLISDLNEDLDFEEEENNKMSRSNQIIDEIDSNSVSKQLNGNYSHKINGFVKSDNKKTTEKVYNSDKNGFTTELNGFSVYNQNSNNSFKIPKKRSQTIESIISHAESMARSSVRPVDAFNYLMKYLTEDQWNREDVKELLLTIANFMVANKDFLANVSKFNQLIDKIKGLQYIEDDFWDQIIYSVDKKKSDSKNTHEIDSFLSSLHDFMANNKISVRLVCTESVIIAYRTLTNHPTAKDLIDYQF